MNVIETIFLISLFGIAYSYFIYPLLLLPFQSRNQHILNSNSDESNLPFLSFIVTAYNEEKNIEKKILNTLEAAYDSDRLEILVASDGSTDNTNDLIKKHRDRRVKIVEVEERKGKEYAQLKAIRQANGDILVFSDVSTRIESNALKRIAQAFANPDIGAVSSEDRFITPDSEIAGEGAYVKYEMWLRKLESNANSLVGLSGSFFACRASICKEWSTNTPSDFNTAINCVKNSLMAISDPELLGYYPNIRDETKEHQRKVRTVLRGMAALFSNPSLLNPFKYGFFSFELISHKLMRWLVPWFMAIAFVSNSLIASQSDLYRMTLLGQFTFYIIAFSGHFLLVIRNNRILKFVYYFVQVNLATAQAMIMYLSGKRITHWDPSKR